MPKLEEYKMEVERKYDELLMKQEGRGISWGELLYFQNLKKAQLQEIEKEIDEELYYASLKEGEENEKQKS